MARLSSVLVALAFGLTGFSALVFEIVWIRQTSLILGVSAYAYAAVVTAFLGGGALGNWIFARIVDPMRHPLCLIFLLQSGVAVLALLTWQIFPYLRLLYALGARGQQLGTTQVFLWRCLLAALILTPTAMLMGGTLPALGRWLAQSSHTGLTARLGRFHAFETLGAAAGCLSAALWLLRFWPSPFAVFAAVGTSLAAAMVALLAERLEDRQEHRPGGPSPPAAVSAADGEADNPSPPRRTHWEILLMYAGSGFVALSYQMIWARILAIFTLDAVFSFAIVLTTFLTGLSLGNALAARNFRRSIPTLATFSRLQWLLALSGLGTIYLFYAMPLISFESLFGHYTLNRAILFEFLLGFLVLLLPTSVMGYLFPVVVHLVTVQHQHLGSAAGRVGGANTAGAILGILVTTFGLVPLIGLQNSLWLLTGGSLCLGVVALWVTKPKFLWHSTWRQPAIVATCLLLGFSFRPPPIYLGFRQDPGEHLVFYEEGVETTVAVFHVVEQNYKVSFVDGRIEVPTDEVSMRAFRALGHLPPLVHPNAQRALMLSFGNGIATGSLDTHGIPEIDAVDLSREMMQAADLYWEENYNVLHSPRLELHVEDGRNFLLRAEQPYDIITADATHPSNTSSWALFTHEFYESARARLTPEGVFLQWLPFHSMTESDFQTILRTFQASFPHATLWYTGSSHSLMMGTAVPFDRQDLEELLDRMEQHSTASADLGSRQQVHDYFALDEFQWQTYVGPGPIATDRQVYFLPAPDQVESIALALLAARQT